MLRGRHRSHRYCDGGRVVAISGFCAGRSQRLRPAIGHPEAFIWLRPIRLPLEEEQACTSPLAVRPTGRRLPWPVLATPTWVRPLRTNGTRCGGGGVVSGQVVSVRQPRAGPASRKAEGKRGGRNRQGRPEVAVGAPALVSSTDLWGVPSPSGPPMACSLTVGPGLRSCSVNYRGLIVSPQEPPLALKRPQSPIKRV